MSLDRIMARNEEAIKTLDKDLQPVARYMVEQAFADGRPVLITEGRRSRERQQQLYNQGRTTPGRIVTNTMESRHLTGHAFDMVPVSDDGAKVNYDDDEGYEYLGSMAREIGLEWGGDWKNFKDKPNFQVYRGQQPPKVPVTREQALVDESAKAAQAFDASQNTSMLTDVRSLADILEPSEGSQIPEPEVMEGVSPQSIQANMETAPSTPPMGLPPLPGEGQAPVGSDGIALPTALPGASSGPLPTGEAPPMMAPQEISSRSGLDNPSYDRTAITPVNTTRQELDLFELNEQMARENFQASEYYRQNREAYDRTLNYYSDYKFVPLSKSEVIRNSLMPGTGRLFNPVAAGQDMSDRFKIENDRREDLQSKALKANFYSAWQGTLETAHRWTNFDTDSGRFLTGLDSGFKPDANFSASRWMSENKIDGQALYSVKDGRYYDLVQASTSAGEAMFWIAAAQERAKLIEMVQSPSGGKQFLYGMIADMADPVNYWTYVGGGIALKLAAKSTAIGRRLATSTTVAGALGREAVVEGVNVGSYLAINYARGEINTTEDFVIELGTAGLMSAIGGTLGGSFRNSAGPNVTGVDLDAEVAAHTERAAQAQELQLQYEEKARRDLPADATEEEVEAKVNDMLDRDRLKYQRAGAVEWDEDKKLTRATPETTSRADKLEELLALREKAKKLNEARAKTRQQVAEQNARADEQDAANTQMYEQQMEEWRQYTSNAQSEEAVGSTPQNQSELPEQIVEAAETADNTNLTSFKAPENTFTREVETYRAGNSTFNVEFSNDLERAAWVLGSSSKVKQKNNEALKKALRDAGIEPRDVSALGKLMRQRAKEAVKKGQVKKGDTISASNLVDEQAIRRHFGEDGTRVVTPPRERLDASDISSVRNRYKAASNLSGARARYRNFDLEFSNDYDRISYLISRPDASAHRGRMLKDLENAGLDTTAAREHGDQLHQAIKDRVGEAQSGSPINASALVSDEVAAGILAGARAKTRTRAQDRAARRLSQEPKAPKPVGRRQLSPEDMVDEEVISIDQMRDELNLDPEFRLIPDLKRAVELQAQHDALKKMKTPDRLDVKAALASGITKVYNAVGLRAFNPTTTVGLSSEIPETRKIFAALAENPTGAINVRTVAMSKETLQRQFMGQFTQKYSATLNAYIRLHGERASLKNINTKRKVEFDDKFTIWQLNRLNGKPELNEVYFTPKEQEIFNILSFESNMLYDNMRLMQVDKKVRGSEGLPDKSDGYFPIRISDEKLNSLTTEQLNAYAEVLAEELRIGNPDFTPDEASGIARRWLTEAKLRATSGDYVSSSAYSRRGESEIEDAINAMRENGEATPEQAEVMLGKYRAGQMNHTKARMNRDLTRTFWTGPDGAELKLIDIMEKDPLFLLRSQAGRVAGEIALKDAGVDGAQGLKALREYMVFRNEKPEVLDAYDQIATQLLGLPLNRQTRGHQITDTLASYVRGTSLGRLVFAQAGEVANMMPVTGVLGVHRIFPGWFKRMQDIKVDANGKPSDSLIGELSMASGGIGTDHARFVMPIGETGRDLDIAYSTGHMSGVARILASAENIQGKLTGFHYMLAGQQRWASEEIAKASAKAIRSGTNKGALRSMGLDDELIEKLQKETDVFKFDENGDLIELNILKAKDAGAIADYIQLVRRGAGQAIQETFIGETGSFIRSPILKLMSVLRSFFIASIQKQTLRQFQDLGAWQTMGYMFSGMMLTAPIQYAKIQLATVGMSAEEREKYLEDRMAMSQFGLTVASYGQALGAIVELSSIPLALAGVETNTARGPQGVSLGRFIPAFGKIESLASVGGDALEGNFHRVQGLVPGGSTPQANLMMNLMFSEDEE